MKTIIRKIYNALVNMRYACAVFVYSLVLKKVGKNLKLRKGVVLNSPQNITLGDDVFINANTTLNGEGGIEIGNSVLIGPNVNIWSSNHIFSSVQIPIAHQGNVYKKVIIGDDVWIGSNVVILPGVKIGKGVVIGAGSIVTKNIDDFGVAVGNPAKVIRFRS